MKGVEIKNAGVTGGDGTRQCGESVMVRGERGCGMVVQCGGKLDGAAVLGVWGCGGQSVSGAEILPALRNTEAKNIPSCHLKSAVPLYCPAI